MVDVDASAIVRSLCGHFYNSSRLWALDHFCERVADAGGVSALLHGLATTDALCVPDALVSVARCAVVAAGVLRTMAPKLQVVTYPTLFAVALTL